MEAYKKECKSASTLNLKSKGKAKNLHSPLFLPCYLGEEGESSFYLNRFYRLKGENVFYKFYFSGVLIFFWLRSERE